MKREALMHGVSPLEGFPSSTLSSACSRNLLFPCSTLHARKQVLPSSLSSRSLLCITFFFTARTQIRRVVHEGIKGGMRWSLACYLFGPRAQSIGGEKEGKLGEGRFPPANGPLGARMGPTG